MTPTVLVLIALAAGEAFALVKVRKQNKRLTRLERKTGCDNDAELALNATGGKNSVS